MKCSKKNLFIFTLAVSSILLTVPKVHAYALLGVKWHGSHPRVPYYVSTANSGFAPYNAPLEDGITAIKNAAEVWNTQGNSEIKFQYAGTSDISVAANDGVNVILFSPNQCPHVGTGCVAETILYYAPDTLIEGFDIVLYARRSGDGLPLYWTADDIISGIDISSIVLHELGHALGLGHSQTQAVMATGCGPGCDARSLVVDDRNGIQAIYGAYTNDGIMVSKATPVPGDTVTLSLDYPLAAGQRFQIVADFDDTSGDCPLRTSWTVDSRIFPLDRMPYTIASWDRSSLERFVLPISSGVLDPQGRASVPVKIPAAAAGLPRNLQWSFSVVTYDTAYSPSQIEDVGVAVKIEVQSAQQAAKLLAKQ